jgi:SAM-dependent methyltransferase
MLEKTRKIWKRKAQAKLFDVAGMGGYLEDREMMALEEHMGFHGQIPEHRRFQITELKKLGLKPSKSVLEIGCGPLTAGIPVIQYLEPNRYVGVDVRPAVLDAAWQQIGKHELSGKNPRLICSDDFANEALGEQRFDYIWAFSVLFHLADDILDRLFASVARRGPMIANVQTNMESSTWLEFPFLKRSIEDYAAAAAKHGLKTEELGTLEQRGFRLQGEERRNPLLRFVPQ